MGLSNPVTIFILVLAAMVLALALLILIGSRLLDPPLHQRQRSRGAGVGLVTEEGSERK